MHDDVIKWKHIPRYSPFVRGIHRSPVNSTHKSQRRGALTFSLICAWINCWVNNGEAGDLRRHHAHYDVAVMMRQWIGSALLVQIMACRIFVSERAAIFSRGGDELSHSVWPALLTTTSITEWIYIESKTMNLEQDAKCSECYYLLTDLVMRIHCDVIKWKHFPRYWPFVKWISWSPMYSPNKSQ